MKNKLGIVIILLLSTTLVLSIAQQSGSLGEYDPHYDGDMSGKIDPYDFAYFASIYGAEGNPINWTQLLEDVNELQLKAESLEERIQRLEEGLPFLDDFNDGVLDGWTRHTGSWSIDWQDSGDGYYVGSNGLTIIDGINQSDCVIEVTIRFNNTPLGFRAGVIFRYINESHYYYCPLSDHYDDVAICRISPDNPTFGHLINSTGNWQYPIQSDTDYLLKVIVQGNVFRCSINDQLIVSGSDGNYTVGKIGFRVHSAYAFFDDIKITWID